MTNTTGESGVGGRSELLADELAIRKDLALIHRAYREGWPIDPEKAAMLSDRLFEITGKRTVTVITKEGMAEAEGPADVNAIAAARVLVAMAGQNQKLEPRQVEHRHIHEIGPVTEANIEQHRQLRAERLAGIVGEVSNG